MSGFSIAGRQIGQGHLCYIIAEMSVNQAHSLEKAVQVIHAAK